ncbi:MAG: T9SS type A sorting domain-containing protein [Candidatus Latescibacteria bacterium]|nr:T9SS type A sorting domain-containing protein [Candidatus Latescibacterota bacterium]NIO29047.1 T9SS type A sorting domain-containing protein [Candidatus Latescibacterota bacterium]NIO56672.1 T9SS type A sorting domain-containing protein [Candidatus Latescibacterota bacterium]NIT02255.1 T9SS type A sorting domain-containing protein [Candidatus Latescibacterota bacterium]NIT39140.1 T9SS type A sorting domain-containing protein [Candidatus Latescibacterota bacterium]
MSTRNLAEFLSVSIVLLTLSSAHAIWPRDGIPICTGPDYDSPVCIVPDTAGGAILAWISEPHDPHINLRAQKIDSKGVLQWGPNGIYLLPPGELNVGACMIPDGMDGAFIAWIHIDGAGMQRILAMRIYPDGSTADLPVSELYGMHYFTRITSDCEGGVILAWEEGRPPATYNDIYAQRDSSDGSALWGSGGVAICTATGYQRRPQLALGGAGGAIIVWQDHRGAPDIYAQRVDSSGDVLWAANGVAICTAGGEQDKQQIIPDGVGGAITIWQDKRGGDFDIYAQRVDSFGNVMWTTNGVAVCTDINDQDYPFLVSDGAQGAFIAWRDLRKGNYDVYAQRIDDGGNILWEANGIEISGGDGNQRCHRIVEDGEDGAIITWVDEQVTDFNVYAQRIDGDGNFKWSCCGVPVCTAEGDQDVTVMAHVDLGTVIIGWQDKRDGEVPDVYAAKISDETVIGVSDNIRTFPYGSGVTIISRPNPFNPHAFIDYHLPEQCCVTLDIYDSLGQKITSLVNREQGIGSYTVEWNGRDERGHHVGSGVYFAHIKAGDHSKTTKLVLIR